MAKRRQNIPSTALVLHSTEAVQQQLSSVPRNLRLRIATALHARLFDAMQDHARRCRECYHPIIDEEGNPGLYGEACTLGVKMMKAYEWLENEIARMETATSPPKSGHGRY